MNGVSVNDIYEWMGDFSNIHPVAKMAARVSTTESQIRSTLHRSQLFQLGQSFSTTKKGLDLSRLQLRQTRDIGSGKTCFTDGVGIIAPWLVEKLCHELHIDTNVYRPCAFQIRFGGYKGHSSSFVAQDLE